MWCTGEKLAKKLDRRLAQHRAEEGDPPAVYTTTGVDCISIGIGENSGSVKRSKVTSPKVGESSRDLGDIQPTKGKVSEKILIFLYVQNSWLLAQRKRAQAEYVPEYRSGPYGIIIALFRAQQVIVWLFECCLSHSPPSSPDTETKLDRSPDKDTAHVTGPAILRQVFHHSMSSQQCRL